MESRRSRLNPEILSKKTLIQATIIPGSDRDIDFREGLSLDMQGTE